MIGHFSDEETKVKSIGVLHKGMGKGFFPNLFLKMLTE